MCCPRRSVRAVASRHQRDDGVPNGASREATSTEEVANSIAVLGCEWAASKLCALTGGPRGFESCSLQQRVACESDLWCSILRKRAGSSTGPFHGRDT